MGLKVTFFGSPKEALPALEKLLEAGHELLAVYTRPDRAAGRSRRSRPTAVKAAAESRGIHVETPRSLRDTVVQEQLRGQNNDLFVVVAYGRILPPEILNIPRLGVVNIHPSLLPRHRGPSPVSTAILNGDSETGVTVMLLDEGMDSGPVLAQSDPVALVGDERAEELTARLFEIGADMLPNVIAGLENGSTKPVSQDESQVTVTSLIEKEHGQIDWSHSASSIERMTRAFDPWPGAFTSLRGKNLKIISAAITNTGSSEGSPGLMQIRDRKLFVATGKGELELKEVQPEGKRPMSAQDFINGTPDLAGTKLGV